MNRAMGGYGRWWRCDEVTEERERGHGVIGNEKMGTDQVVWQLMRAVCRRSLNKAKLCSCD